MVEANNKQPQFCIRCGGGLTTEMKFCSQCGEKINQNTAQQLNRVFKDTFIRLKITKESVQNLREFMKNNFELVHFLYLIIFIVSMFSTKVAVLMLIVGCFFIFYLSTKSKLEIMANDKLKHFLSKIFTRSNKAATTLVGKTQVLVDKAIAVKETTTSENEEVVNAEIAKNTIRLEDAQTQVIDTSENIQDKELVVNEIQMTKSSNDLGISGVLLILSVIFSLFGVLGQRFLVYPEDNLFYLLKSTSKYAAYYGNIEAVFTENPSINTKLIEFVAYSLIGFPILIVVFSLMQSKASKMLGFLLSLVELGSFIFIGIYVSENIISRLGNYSTDFFSLLFENSNQILGIPIYALLIGTLGMVLFSFRRLIKQ